MQATGSQVNSEIRQKYKNRMMNERKKQWIMYIKG